MKLTESEKSLLESIHHLAYTVGERDGLGARPSGSYCPGYDSRMDRANDDMRNAEQELIENLRNIVREMIRESK